MKLSVDDYVIVTLGSMADSATLGTMNRLRPTSRRLRGAGWHLWEKISAGRPEFGRPSAFDSRPDQSKWVSFTGTLRDPLFFSIVKKFTDNVPGEGGLVTFADFGLDGVDHASRISRTLLSVSPRILVCCGVMAFTSTVPATLSKKPMSGLHRTRDHDRSSGPP